jgi:hypothetical protein
MADSLQAPDATAPFGRWRIDVMTGSRYRGAPERGFSTA